MAKSLVLYFSVYGTAKNVAEEIARQTGADIMEIEPAVPYDSDRNHYNDLAKLAKKEHDEDQRPAIKNAIPVQDYDTFFIGYPMWWYTFPMILSTLVDQYDFQREDHHSLQHPHGQRGWRHLQNSEAPRTERYRAGWASRGDDPSGTGRRGSDHPMAESHQTNLSLTGRNAGFLLPSFFLSGNCTSNPNGRPRR